MIEARAATATFPLFGAEVGDSSITSR